MLMQFRLLLLLHFHWILLPSSATLLRRRNIEHVVEHRAGSWNSSLSRGQIKHSEASKTASTVTTDAKVLPTGSLGHQRPHSKLTSVDTTGYIDGYGKFCALWDSSCTAESEHEAFMNYWDIINWDTGHFCNQVAQDAYYDSIGASLPYQRIQLVACTQDLSDAPQTSKAAVQKMIDFARSPRCTSMLKHENCSPDPKALACTYDGLTGPCGGHCVFDEAVVELFYWPVEDGDTSCLEIIGDAVRDEGFVTHPNGTHDWGCTTLSTAHNGSVLSEYFKTATTMVGNPHFTWKQELIDPWATDIPCVGSSEYPTKSHTTSKDATALQVRAHALLNSTQLAVESNTTANRVAIHNGHTL